ncbi:MAG: hypothetical protein ACC656_08600, partial [Candidatus Heimdallarchaeota archaeon]
KTNRLIRGEEGLLEKKIQAINNLREFNISINLVMTVQKGVNDHEIGKVVNFTHETDGITGLTLQPFFAEGRYDNYDPMDHTTMADVIHQISSQTKDMYVKDDFYPIPCPFPHCSAVTFSYKDPVSDEFITISRLVDVEDYLDYFRNTLFPELDQDVLEALESIFSFSSISGSHEMIEGFCNACGIEFNFDDIQESLGHYLKNVKMITIKPFMNAWDFDVRRIMKCCVHEVTEDKKLIPFCAYNAIYRKNYQSNSIKILLDVIE